MTDATPANWHPDPAGRHQLRYWDGSAWSEYVADDGVQAIDPLVPAVPPQSGSASNVEPTFRSEPQPIIELESHIAGKNAKVRLWPDRLEWERQRGVSGGKITAGIMTGGASLLVTGVKGGKDAYDMVLLKNVTNVSNRKDGLMYHVVEVQTASGGAINTIGFRVSRDEAVQFRGAILTAIQALESNSGTTVVVQREPATDASSEATAGPVDHVTQLQQLAGLRDAGVLTDEEFAAKKAEILARI